MTRSVASKGWVRTVVCAALLPCGATRAAEPRRGQQPTRRQSLRLWIDRTAPTVGAWCGADSPTGATRECPLEVGRNITLTPGATALWEAVDRCASPFYHIREISPEHVSWSAAPAPAPVPTPPGNAAAAASASEGSNTTTNPPTPDEPAANRSSSSGAGGAAEATPDAPEPHFLAFFLFMHGNVFSAELETIVQAVAPAFPKIMFVKGDGVNFSSFVAQYSVRSLPRLLLFKDGVLVSQFRGNRSPSALAAHLTNRTTMLPAARIEPDPEPLPFEPRRDPLSVLALVFVLVKLLWWLHDHRTSLAWVLRVIAGPRCTAARSTATSPASPSPPHAAAGLASQAADEPDEVPPSPAEQPE